LAFAVFLGLLWFASLRATILGGDQWLFMLSAFVSVSYMMLVWLLYPAGYTLVVFGFIALFYISFWIYKTT